MSEELKLWVVGESDPDPSTWSIWNEYAIVLAPNAEAAIEMVGPGYDKAAEIDTTKPVVLAVMPEPAWGEDL